MFCILSYEGAWAPIRIYVWFFDSHVKIEKNRRGARLVLFFLTAKRNTFNNLPCGPIHHHFCRKLNCAPAAFGGGDAFYVFCIIKKTKKTRVFGKIVFSAFLWNHTMFYSLHAVKTVTVYCCGPRLPAGCVTGGIQCIRRWRSRLSYICLPTGWFGTLLTLGWWCWTTLWRAPLVTYRNTMNIGLLHRIPCMHDYGGTCCCRLRMVAGPTAMRCFFFSRFAWLWRALAVGWRPFLSLFSDAL